MNRSFRTRLASALALLVAAGAALAGDDAGPVAAEGGRAPAGRAAAAFRELAGGETPQPALVRLIDDNAEAWYIRWFLLENARESIDATYFIVDDDVFGKSFLGLLAKRAREGVKVRLMVDRRGSKHLTKLFHTAWLRGLASLPGVEVRVFNPFHQALLSLPGDVRELVASNHDKILLVDGKRVLTGGRNIGWHYFADPATHPTARRDSDVLLESAAVAGEARTAFEEEFHGLRAMELGSRGGRGEEDALDELETARRVMQRWLLGRGVHDEEASRGALRSLRDLSDEVSAYRNLQGYMGFTRGLWHGRRAFPTKVLDKHSFRRPKNEITGNMVRLLDAAEHSIHLQNPYVVLTRPVHEALKRASDRGVAITLHTNGPVSSNQPITQAFFLRDWKKLLRDMPTLRIFVYAGERCLHAKNIVIDDRIAAVGTYNLDPLSESVNGECMAVIESSTLARRLRERIDRDCAESREWTVRVRPDGVVETVAGPGPDEEAKAAGWIRFFRFFRFLRPLV